MIIFSSNCIILFMSGQKQNIYFHSNSSFFSKGAIPVQRWEKPFCVLGFIFQMNSKAMGH